MWLNFYDSVLQAWSNTIKLREKITFITCELKQRIMVCVRILLHDKEEDVYTRTQLLKLHISNKRTSWCIWLSGESKVDSDLKEDIKLGMFCGNLMTNTTSFYHDTGKAKEILIIGEDDVQKGRHSFITNTRLTYFFEFKSKEWWEIYHRSQFTCKKKLDEREMTDHEGVSTRSSCEKVHRLLGFIRVSDVKFAKMTVSVYLWRLPCCLMEDSNWKFRSDYHGENAMVMITPTKTPSKWVT